VLIVPRPTDLPAT